MKIIIIMLLCALTISYADEKTYKMNVEKEEKVNLDNRKKSLMSFSSGIIKENKFPALEGLVDDLEKEIYRQLPKTGRKVEYQTFIATKNKFVKSVISGQYQELYNALEATLTTKEGNQQDVFERCYVINCFAFILADKKILPTLKALYWEKNSTLTFRNTLLLAISALSGNADEFINPLVIRKFQQKELSSEWMFNSHLNRNLHFYLKVLRQQGHVKFIVTNTSLLLEKVKCVRALKEVVISYYQVYGFKKSLELFNEKNRFNKDYHKSVVFSELLVYHKLNQTARYSHKDLQILKTYLQQFGKSGDSFGEIGQILLNANYKENLPLINKVFKEVMKAYPEKGKLDAMSVNLEKQMNAVVIKKIYETYFE